MGIHLYLSEEAKKNVHERLIIDLVNQVRISAKILKIKILEDSIVIDLSSYSMLKHHDEISSSEVQIYKGLERELNISGKNVIIPFSSILYAFYL